MKSETRLGITLLVLALALFALVILLMGGFSVVSAQDGPADVQPPVKCEAGVAVMSATVFRAAFNHVAPCAWIVRFDHEGKWKLEAGPVPIATSKSFHFPLCKVTAAGFVKARPGCAIVVRAVDGTPEGKSWRFFLQQADPVPPQ